MASESRLAQAWLAAARGAKDAPLPGRLLVYLLFPLSLLFVVGFTIYLITERIGLRKRTRLSVPVISIGNLTMGGTGKTAVVQYLADRLVQDYRTAVLLRGYHGKSDEDHLVVSEGGNQATLVSAEKSGDEAAMLAAGNKSLVVVTGKDRRISGRVAVNDLGAELVMLDDGLQYWQLHRDLDIILIDAVNPFGNGLVIPAGILREPVQGLKRAQIVILTHANEVDASTLQSLRQTVSHLAPEAGVYTASYVPSGSITSTGQQLSLEQLSGKSGIAACGLGSPLSFFRTVQSAGIKVLDRVSYSDHHRFTQKDVDHLSLTAAEQRADVVIFSMKDWVKLETFKLPESFMALKAELQITGGRLLEQAVRSHLEAHAESTRLQ